MSAATTTVSPLLDAALAYAGRGWPVFPVTGKRPHPKAASHGLYDATTNALTITRLLDRHPDATGLAVPTGAGSGLAVVDMDGPEGIALARDLARRYGIDWRTLWSVTGRDAGFHAWFRDPDGAVPNTTGKAAGGLGEGIDTRGEGPGYVVVPPSIHYGPDGKPSGRRYAWWNPRREPAPVPEGLLRALVDAKPSPPTTPPRPVPIDRALGRYAGVALEAEARAVAGAVKPGRNEQLNRSAFALGTLVGAGQLDEAHVVARLEHAGLLNGLWDDRDDGPARCRATIRSGLTAGIARPREVAS